MARDCSDIPRLKAPSGISALRSMMPFPSRNRSKSDLPGRSGSVPPEYPPFSIARFKGHCIPIGGCFSFFASISYAIPALTGGWCRNTIATPSPHWAGLPAYWRGPSRLHAQPAGKEGQPMRTDVYQKITDRIVAELEKGVRPWMKPWSAGHGDGRIMRPLRANGIPYQGINVWMPAAALHADHWPGDTGARCRPRSCRLRSRLIRRRGHGRRGCRVRILTAQRRVTLFLRKQCDGCHDHQETLRRGGNRTFGDRERQPKSDYQERACDDAFDA